MQEVLSFFTNIVACMYANAVSGEEFRLAQH